jgi:hypothetical protein
MHPALYLAVRSTRRRNRTPRAHGSECAPGRRRAVAAGTIAVLIAAGGVVAETQASVNSQAAQAAAVALPSSHVIGIGESEAIVTPGRLGWQRHCPANGWVRR